VSQLELPQWCGIMDFVGSSLEAKTRTAKANRSFVRLRDELDKARKELAAAIVAERKEGELIEDIAARVTYRQTQVNRILEAAGLTEKRAKPDA